VQLSFIVDRDGDVRDVIALNDPGYGSKEEAMRVLLSSPKWTPAMLNGKKVVFRNKIAITYVVSEE
jgi:protein TonB